MTITPAPITGFPLGTQPYTDITPFTHRDGRTYLRTLEELRAWLKDDLVPWLDSTAGELNTAWQAEVSSLVATVDAALAAQAGGVNADIAALETYVNEQVQLIITDSIQVQDPVIAGAITNPLSATHAALVDFLPGADELADNTTAEGRAVIQNVSKSLNRYDMKFYGADSTGVAVVDTVWNTIISAGNDSMVIVFPPGTYRVNAPLLNNGKSVHVIADGAKFIRDGDMTDEEVFSFSGSFSEVYTVTGMTSSTVADEGRAVTTLTVAGVHDFAVGDLVKIISDDPVPATRTTQSLMGMWAWVSEVSGATVKVLGAPIDPMVNSIRVARLNRVTCSVNGGEYTRADLVPVTGGAAIWFRSLLYPVAKNISIPYSTGAGVHFSSCFGYTAEDVRIGYVRDTWDETGSTGAVLSYGILDTNSFAGVVRGLSADGVRHAFTTAQGSPPVGVGTSANPALHGITEFTEITGVSRASYAASFDTHEASYGVRFIGCRSIGSGYAGYSLRGRAHFIGDSSAIGCFVGLRVFDDNLGGESYNHHISSFVVEAPVSDSIIVSVHPTGHPNAGVRSTYRALTVDGLTVRKLRGRILVSTNARVHMVNIDATYEGVASTTAPALAALLNSELTGEHATLDVRGLTSGSPAVIHIAGGSGDTSRGEFDSVRVRGTLDRVARSSQVTASVVVTGVLADASAEVGDSSLADGSIIDLMTLNASQDSARVAVTATTVAATLRRLGMTLRPTLTIQGALTGAYTLPLIPAGKVSGQLLTIRNRPTSTGTMTVLHGATGGTYLINATDKTIAPGESMQLQWDQTAWYQI